jgi:ABC-type transporter Mla MlaB component
MSDLLPLTVENAKKNRETLLALLDGTTSAKGPSATNAAPSATLDISGFEAIDLSGLQLLVAFAREAAARGKNLSFSGTVPECLSRALSVSGLAPSGCETADDVLIAIKAASK